MNIKIVNSNESGIEQAIITLRNGGVTILPTENVYGFFVNGQFENSVERVYQIKHRDINKPMVLFVTKDSAEQYAFLNPSAEKIIEHCWPAPVSIVLKKRKNVSDIITRGLDTVAMMQLSSAVIDRVCRIVEGPICGTTCNYSGEPEIKKSSVAVELFEKDVDLIVEGDELLSFGKPSTIVDLSGSTPKVLRVGAFPVDRLREDYLPSLINELL